MRPRSPRRTTCTAALLLGCLIFCGHSTLQAQTPTPAASAAPAKKIVLIAGPITGHGKQTHEYEKSVILLKHLLDTSPQLKGVNVEAHFQGWPADEKTLNDAATIVLISDGGDRREQDHPLYVGQRLQVLEKQMQRGCGFLSFHWTTFHPSRFHDKITDWVGGYFDYETGPGPRKWFSAISTWRGDVGLPSPEHPIVRGVKPFSLQEEFYYNIRFRDNDPRLTAIVTARPPGDKKDHTVGWAVERKDGGRGFGFTGGHFYGNWWEPNYRKLLLNAIVWTAGLDVPAGGVESLPNDPFKVLIVTGYHHPGHDWRKLTAALILVIEQDPRAIVEVTENVEDLATKKLSDYATLVMNYNNWDRGGLSDEAKAGLLKYLQQGGGLSIIHFANGAFTNTLPNKTGDWPEYRDHIVRRIWDHTPGKSGHDPFGTFRVEPTAVPHPITKGLEPFETTDELYFRQQGALPIVPLAVATSKVTKQDEPMAWAYTYEKARVFQTVLGHADSSVRKAGALIRRGTVWASSREPLTFDPPVSLTEKALFRSGSTWTIEQSLKNAGLPVSPANTSSSTSTATPNPGGLGQKELNPADLLTAGKFGKGLNTSTAGVFVPGKPEYRTPPMTVECWARLNSKQSYNILIASDPKSSAAHWEIFTLPTSGKLTLYTPGYQPDHLHSSADICDDHWHYIALRFAPDSAELYVDGKRVAQQSIKRVKDSVVPGPLAFGRLATGDMQCKGLIDEIRLSAGLRDVTSLPEKPFSVDDRTLGLWHCDDLDDDKRFRDESPHKNAARTWWPATSGTQSSSNAPASKTGKIAGHWGEEAVGFRWTEQDSVDNRWNATDVGRQLASLVPLPTGTVLKGLSLKLGTTATQSPLATLCYDTASMTLRAGWTDGFLQFSPARYGLIQPPRLDGPLLFTSPELKSSTMPKVRYRGLYPHATHPVLSYTVDDIPVLESPSASLLDKQPVIVRHWTWGQHTHAVSWPLFHANGAPLTPQIVQEVPLITLTRDDHIVAFALAPTAPISPDAKSPQRPDSTPEMPRLDITTQDTLLLRLPPAKAPQHVQLLVWTGKPDALDAFARHLRRLAPASDVTPLCQPGPRQWMAPIVTRGVLGTSQEAYVLDTLTLPFDNPYRALFFVSGHDFFRNGDLAVCTVHGDVWRVSGVDDKLEKLTWTRYATGLFQPLGLKIVDDLVYVRGRDQITRLHDRNGDGEADFYENFHNDSITSPGGHDYVACLETDSQGRFYFVHATQGVQRVSKEGTRLETVATGFRNPNGMFVGPDDIITVSPQEGDWTPASNVTIVKEQGYYGFGGPRVTPLRPLGYDPPVCWIPRLQDNSSGGQVWVSGDRFGPLQNQLLHLSYGQSRALLTLREEIRNPDYPWKDIQQGGTLTLPWVFDSGAMRGRMSPHDGQLYVSGMRGWVSNAARDGCLHRVRYTGQPADLPLQMKTYQNGIALTFSRELDPATAEDPESFHLEQWNYVWSGSYGSAEYKVSAPKETGRDPVPVRGAMLLADRKTVFLEIPTLAPVMQLAIQYQLLAKGGSEFRQTFYATLHGLRPDSIDTRLLVRKRRAGELDDALQRRLQPGLLVRFTSAPDMPDRNSPSSKLQDVRSTRMAALSVAAGQPPTPFLPPGPFTARLEGFLQVPLRGDYRFSLQGTGRCELRLNGTTLLQGDRDLARIPQATVRLHQGFNRIEIDYASPDNQPARLRLLWQGENVPREAVPATSLFFDSGAPGYQTADELRTGRELFAQARCARCHASPTPFLPEYDRPGPNLSTAGSRLTRDWLLAWLADPNRLRNHTTMPRLFSQPDSPQQSQELADLVAYVMSRQGSNEGSEKKPAVTSPPQSPPQSQPESQPQSPSQSQSPSQPQSQLQPQSQSKNSFNTLLGKGRALFEDLSCISCHRLTGPRAEDDYDRISLHFVDRKYTESGLQQFLEQPHKFYAWSPMPDFRLQRQEIEALTVYLKVAASEARKAEESDAAFAKSVATFATQMARSQPERGAQLWTEKACAHCHASEAHAQPAPPRAGPLWSKADKPSPATRGATSSAVAAAASTFERGCLARDDSPTGTAPRWSMTAAQRQALVRFLQSDERALRQRVPAETASRWMAQLRCHACHPRDARPSPRGIIISEEGERGLAPEVLPSLSWTGEKLQAPWLRTMLRGDLAYRSRPWLKARMPAFPQHSALLAEGLAFEHGLTDIRESPGEIIEAANGLQNSLARQLLSKRVEIGLELTQKTALDCRQCHAIGPQRPTGDERTQIAHGINFAYTKERLRYDFYQRFVIDPPRYDIGTKMPKLSPDGTTTKVTHILQGRAVDQFDAVWHYIQNLPVHREE